MYHYIGSGLSNVWLRNGYTTQDTLYGEAVSIHDMDGLHKTIGLYIINNRPDLDNEEVRFLRKELDLTQLQVANILGVSESTVRNWENGRKPMPKAPGIVLRALYASFVDENGCVREIIDRIGQMNREEFHRDLELEETSEGWKEAA